MKIAACLLSLAVCMPFADAVESGSTRFALVIGNAEYQEAGRLDCTAKDAETMAKMLSGCQFNVAERHDLTKKSLLAEVKKFAASLPEGGVAFFYFSGHGVQSNGKNYLVPLDMKVSGDVAASSVELKVVFEALAEAKTAINIVVLDCCRSHVVVRGKEGFAETAAPPNTVIAFATAPGHGALDGEPPGPGPYSAALARHLAQPGVEFFQALRKAGQDVRKETNGDQQPWFHSDINEMFYLRPLAGRAGGDIRFESGEKSAAVLTFARQFLAADESNDPGVVLQYYAPSVENYFGNSKVSGSDIVTDRRKGILAAPERKYRLQKAPMISRTDGDGSYTVICERLCEVGHDETEGSLKVRPSHIAFKVRPHGDSWEIFYITSHQPKRDETESQQAGESFNSAALEQFLISFDSADEEDDPALGMKYFAPKVTRYFNVSEPTHEKILADRVAHRKRWPVRQYLPQSYRVLEVRPGELKVEYLTKYEHHRGKEIKRDSIRNWVTLQIVRQNQFQIVEIQAASKS